MRRGFSGCAHPTSACSEIQQESRTATQDEIYVYGTVRPASRALGFSGTALPSCEVNCSNLRRSS